MAGIAFYVLTSAIYDSSSDMPKALHGFRSSPARPDTSPCVIPNAAKDLFSRVGRDSVSGLRYTPTLQLFKTEQNLIVLMVCRYY